MRGDGWGRGGGQRGRPVGGTCSVGGGQVLC